MEWGKFYPKIVIQIGVVELSPPKSHVQLFIQKSVPKKIIQNYKTYLTLNYMQQNNYPKNIPLVEHIL